MSVEKHNRLLRFYFDYISHNAYLAWVQLPELAQQFNLDIEPVPVLFAGLLNANGQLGPAEIPSKARWMVRDVLRKASLLNIPINPPASHPFNPLLPLRVTCLVEPGQQRDRLIDAFFKAAWVDSLDISSEETVLSILRQNAFQASQLVEQAALPQVKQRLHRNTAAAIEADVFGVPAMQIDQQHFWGFDDFPHLQRYLQGDDPLDHSEYARWLNTRASSQRTRQ